ncbi:MAG TPA: ATP-binding protein [Anaerolineales bacterium]
MDIGLLLVYFVYGLAFWAMGLAVLLESGRAPSTAEARRLQWLSAFGVVHGTHEWLEAYLLVARALGFPLPPWLDWLRLALLTGSFAALVVFAVGSLRAVPSSNERSHWQVAVPLFVALWFLAAVGLSRHSSALHWVSSLDAVARYSLAVPAAVLASMALMASARSFAAQGNATISSNLRLAGAAFGGYALGQLFVHKLDWFPASMLNQEMLRSATGIPIQGIRALMAALIAAGLLRAARAAEEDRKIQLAAADRARLAAVEEQDLLRRDLLRHVVRSQEDERARIARELHDQVAQLLSAFTLQLASLRPKLKRTDTLEIVDQLQDLARQMSQSLYGLVRDLRPSHLDNLGLVPAVKFLLSQDFQPKGLDVDFQVHGNARPLRGLIDTALFRVVQESLANVLRHADIQQASVDLQYDADRVVLRICDGGRGFNPAEPFRPPRGWGLAGMRERVEALGGQLSLQSAPSQGTTVQVIVPLTEGTPKDGQHA